MSDTKLHYKILRDTQLKRTTDKQGIKRIHDFLLVVVFYEKNRLLDKDICLKGGGQSFGTTYTKLNSGGLYEARIEIKNPLLSA